MRHTQAPYTGPDLSNEELQRLEAAEATIRASKAHRLAEGRALLTISAGRLYRATHQTFEDYCQKRWGFSRQHAQRLMDFAEVTENLSPIGGEVMPKCESQARPLVGLTPDQQRRAWTTLLEGGTQITANSVDAVASKIKLTPVNGEPSNAEVVPSEMRTPLRWFGSKSRIASKIVAVLPPHETYVEPFAGGCAVLFAKHAAKVEIINDIDNDVVTFFKVLREHGAELQRRLELTPYARAEHQSCKDNPSVENEIERARRFFVRTRQSFGGVVDDCWSTSFTRDHAGVAKKVIDGLLETSARLRRVQIENQDFREFLGRIPDEPGVLINADPTYLLTARSRNGDAYRHEMSEQDHTDLLSVLSRYCQAKVALSGYDADLYNTSLRGWQRYEFRQRINNVGGSGLTDRTEVIWTNW